MKTMDVLMYFAFTAFVTAAGVLYSVSLEAMHRKGFKAVWAFVLSLLITPFGAYFASLVLRGPHSTEGDIPQTP